MHSESSNGRKPLAREPEWCVPRILSWSASTGTEKGREGAEWGTKKINQMCRPGVGSSINVSHILKLGRTSEIHWSLLGRLCGAVERTRLWVQAGLDLNSSSHLVTEPWTLSWASDCSSGKSSAPGLLWELNSKVWNTWHILPSPWLTLSGHSFSS